jgi:hypothetical protein
MWPWFEYGEKIKKRPDFPPAAIGKIRSPFPLAFVLKALKSNRKRMSPMMLPGPGSLLRFSNKYAKVREAQQAPGH